MNDLLDSPDLQQERRAFSPVVLIVWTVLLCVGLLFRMLHWPFASYMIIYGSAGITARAWSSFVWLRGKDRANNVISIAALIWVAVLVGGALFNDGHPYNRKGLTAFALFFAALFTIHVLVTYLIRRARQRRTDG